MRRARLTSSRNIRHIERETTPAEDKNQRYRPAGNSQRVAHPEKHPR